MYNYKIAVIDDNQAVLRTLKLVLKGVFSSVVTLPHPRSLPALMASEKVDAVLLDMNFSAQNLDGEEGLDWLRYIKKQPYAPAVVLITAFGDIELAVTSLKAGAEDFVTKPWNNEELIEKLLKAINTCAEHHQMNDTLHEANRLKDHRETTRQMTLDELEKQHIEEVLSECNGNVVEATARLGISRQTMYNRMKKYGLSL